MTQPTQNLTFAQYIDLAVNDMITKANPEQVKTAIWVAVTLKDKDLLRKILSHPNGAKIAAQDLTDAIKSAQAKQ